MADCVLSKASSNYKTRKSLAVGGYVGSILYLTPERESGLANLCPFASKGCRAGCLNTAGRGVMAPVQAGRLRKTKLWIQNKPLFFQTLFDELSALQRQAEKKGLKAFVRLNGTSDINWADYRPYQGKTVFQAFPDIQFYDYTKDIRKALHDRNPNYHITFSQAESNRASVALALQAGINVAVVFRKTLPKEYLGRPVLDGDKTDLRFEEGRQGVIVGLTAKGKAKKDKTGFVVDYPPTIDLLENA
jgi:hypothetical protein